MSQDQLQHSINFKIHDPSPMTLEFTIRNGLIPYFNAEIKFGFVPPNQSGYDFFNFNPLGKANKFKPNKVHRIDTIHR